MSAALFSVVYSSQFIRFGSIVTVAIAGSMLILAVRGRGAMGATMTAIGVATILMSSIIQGDLDLKMENIKAHLFWWDQQPQKMQALEGFPTWGKIWSLSTGTVCILLGMISPMCYGRLRPQMSCVGNASGSVRLQVSRPVF